MCGIILDDAGYPGTLGQRPAGVPVHVRVLPVCQQLHGRGVRHPEVQPHPGHLPPRVAQRQHRRELRRGGPRRLWVFVFILGRSF